MSLKMYRVPRRRVDLGDEGAAVELRALSTADMFSLFRGYKEDLKVFFDRLNEIKETGRLDLLQAPTIAAVMLENIPIVAAHAIALAADEPDQTTTAFGLPFPVQLEALQAVYELTFGTEGGIKKVLETVIRISESVTGLATPRSAASSTSTN